jgi:tripeptidyl-peptidase-1
VKSFIKPSSATTSAFNTFASAHGLNVSVISPHEDWVSITLPVSQANDLFAAQFEVYSHPSMSNTITRTLSVSLPQELVGHVQVIHPTTAFVKPGGRMGSMIEHVQHNKRAPSCNTSLPDGIMTPACLQSIYGIPTTPATQSNNALLVTAYQDEFAQTADLEVGVAGEFLQLLNLAHVRRNSSKACVRIWTPLRRSRC